MHVIRAAGVGPGERVAMLAGNRRETYEVFLAVAHTGVLVVPINWHFAADEVEYVVENSGAKLLLLDPDHERTATGVTVPAWCSAPAAATRPRSPAPPPPIPRTSPWAG